MQLIVRVEILCVNVLNILVIFLSPRLMGGTQRILYFSSNDFVLVIFSSPKLRHGKQRMTLVEKLFYFLILFYLGPTNYAPTPLHKRVLWKHIASRLGFACNPWKGLEEKIWCLFSWEKADQYNVHKRIFFPIYVFMTGNKDHKSAIDGDTKVFTWKTLQEKGKNHEIVSSEIFPL